MSEEMLKYQCPACGAPLHYSAEKQLLICDSCDSEFPEDTFKTENPEETVTEDVQEIDWNVEGYVKEKPVMEDQYGFSCTSCGAEVVSDSHTVATECMYCGNPIVMQDNISGMVTPDVVIPFQINQEKAEEMLRNFYKKKPLLPDSFTKGNRLSKIKGMYVPFWLFSCTGEGAISFNATKVRRWSDSDYNYTCTEYYDVYRSGQLGFHQIPVDASTKMDDRYMDGIEPFDYTHLAEFSPMYMAGYFADKFDVSVEESTERANNRVLASTESAFKDTVIGYSTVTKKNASLRMSGDDIKYALLPVWMLNTTYEGKMYQFAINGQSGQVAGELPIDKGKLLKWRIGLTVAAMIPIAAISLLFL